MASLVMLGVGAALNAVAFSGGNYLFSKLGDKGADEETKRHNLAIEKLTRARDEWTQKRTERVDFINTELKKEGHASQVFHDVNEAMKEYYLVTGRHLEELEPEPKLSDYYTPSSDQKTRELVFVALGLGVTGLLVYKFI